MSEKEAGSYHSCLDPCEEKSGDWQYEDAYLAGRLTKEHAYR